MTGYNSPFSYRYGSGTMREAWSRAERVRLLFKIWTNHHNVLVEVGNVQQARVINPTSKLDPAGMDLLLAEIDQAEKEVGHDIVAALRVFQRHARPEIPSLAHTGLTSSDVLDQAILAQTLFSLYQVYSSVRALTQTIYHKVPLDDDKVWLVGRTHLQPAEPTTLLHRLLLYSQDLYNWMRITDKVISELNHYVGLMSGSVGNYANETFALAGFDAPRELVHKDCRLKSQTLPRFLDVQVASQLDQLAAILHKMAFDYRLESGFGNTYEIASKTRVGSSAMPYKHNPINAECIDSLSRHIHHLCGNAWDNAAWQGLDRTLDDSANRRAWLPEAFIATSEILTRSFTLLDDYLTTESVNPDEWSDLWHQARVAAFNQVNSMAIAYDQPRKVPCYDGKAERRADAVDEYLLNRFERHDKDPDWWYLLPLTSPSELIGKS